MANCYVIGGNGGGITQDDLTAAPADVVSGLTFGGAGSDELQIGSMTKRTAMDAAILPGGSVGIPAGWHPAGGTVKNSTGLYTAHGTVIPGAKDQTLQTSGLILRDGITVPGIKNDLPYLASDVSLFGQAGKANRASSYKTLWEGGCRGWWKDGLIDWVTVPSPRYMNKYLYLHWEELTGAHNRRFSPTSLSVTVDKHLDDNVHEQFGFFGYKSVDVTHYDKIVVTATIGPARTGAFPVNKQIRAFLVRVSDGEYTLDGENVDTNYSSTEKTETVELTKIKNMSGEYFIGIGVWLWHSETRDHHDFHGSVTFNRIALE